MDHDYDGIMELNNPAPKWVLAIWYVTIAFSLYYLVFYFIMDGPTQINEYDTASASHDAEYKDAAAPTVTLELLSDEASITEGAALYKSMNCGACHGANGEGNAIGPNLADSTWINGCDFESVFNIIKKGKGSMTAFKSQMDDVKIQKTTSFILTKMKGTTPKKAKAPEGEACE